MPKFVKMSADEAQAKRRDHLANVGGKDLGIVKAAKAPSSWNDTARSARFTMSTASVDRYGDIVVTAGIDTSEFEKNPVGLLFHSSRSWPVGTWSDLTKELNRRPPRLEGTLEMLPEGGPVKEVDEAAWMIANGGIRACSIGFQPNWDEVEGIVDDEGFWTGLKFNASTLLECSVCSVPANAQALIKQADGDPRIARELLEDVLDNWVRSPEGLLLERADFERAYRVTVEKLAEDATGPAPAAAEPEVKADEPAAESAKDEDEPECEPMEAEEEEKAAELAEFKAFLAKHLTDDADDLRVFYKLAGKAAIEKGVTVQHPGTDAIDKFEFKTAMTAEHRAAIEERLVEIAEAKAAPEPENKPETPAPVVVTLSADTSAIEAAATKVEGIFARLAKQFPLFFPKAAEERIEPTIVPPEPPAPPSAEAITAAATKAAAVRERLASKGLIAA